MAKPKVEADKRLYDHIKEIWEILNMGGDPFLNTIGSIDDWLRGYLCCYYKEEPTRCQEAYDYFHEQILMWETGSVD